ncbi:uncharacterized protein LOC117103829 [Anneissia japonica]|uniref:uncharacterized protein LOC117103829 n=1 Tax=Anneissia japonica TaxID=1529436 RepID=UPI00142574B4|nr:uncharacterized protein LOC117103829 [Anneissia japonica]
MNDCKSCLTVDDAFACILETKMSQIKLLNHGDLAKINHNELVHEIRSSMAALLPGDSDKTEIMNHALIIQSKVKNFISSSLSLILSNIPASQQQGTSLSSISATRIKCTATCKFEHLEKGKSLECSLCQEGYHRLCVDLSTKANPRVWICPSCKDIPKNFNKLNGKTSQLEEEVTNLRKLNHSLSLQIKEQNDIIVRLQSSWNNHLCNSTSGTNNNENTQCTTSTNLPKGPLSVSDKPITPHTNLDNPVSPSNYTTLLIGDSIVRDIREKGLQGTKVICMRGAKTLDVLNKLKNVEDFSTIIIHVGTNDCNNNDQMELGINHYNEMINSLRCRIPEANLVLSTVCPRVDNPEHQKRVETFNMNIMNLVNSTENCKLLDNDEAFTLRNGNIVERSLNGGGLHLSKEGTRALLHNINVIHTIIPSHSSNRNTRRPLHSRNQHHRARAYSATSFERASS